MEMEKSYIKTIILEEKIRTYGSDLNVLHMLKSKKDKSEKKQKRVC